MVGNLRILHRFQADLSPLCFVAGAASALSASPCHLPFACSVVSSPAGGSVAPSVQRSLLFVGPGQKCRGISAMEEQHLPSDCWLLVSQVPPLSPSLGGATEARVLHWLRVFMSTIKRHVSVVVTCLVNLLMATLSSLSRFPTSLLKSPGTTCK